VPIDSGPEADESADAIETHPLKSAVTRRPQGYWNEDSLPVTDWEVPTECVVLPEHLQHRLGAEMPPVLRRDAEKFDLVMIKHQRDKAVILNLSQRLDSWTYLGRERASWN